MEAQPYTAGASTSALHCWSQAKDGQREYIPKYQAQPLLQHIGTLIDVLISHSKKTILVHTKQRQRKRCTNRRIWQDSHLSSSIGKPAKILHHIRRQKTDSKQ